MQVILEQRFRFHLKQVLKDHQVSQSVLARKMGVSPQLVGDYFHGRKAPGLDMVERFAVALEVDPLTLLEPIPEFMPIG